MLERELVFDEFTNLAFGPQVFAPRGHESGYHFLPCFECAGGSGDRAPGPFEMYLHVMVCMKISSDLDWVLANQFYFIANRLHLSLKILFLPIILDVWQKFSTLINQSIKLENPC